MCSVAALLFHFMWVVCATVRTCLRACVCGLPLNSLNHLTEEKKINKKIDSCVFPHCIAVKEKEDLHPDVESQGMNDDTFCEYR